MTAPRPPRRTAAAVWAAAAGLWALPPAAWCGLAAGDAVGGWLLFGFLELLAGGIAALAAWQRYGWRREPGAAAPRPPATPGRSGFGSYETLLVSAAFFWGLPVAVVGGFWAADWFASPELGWAAFGVPLAAGAAGAWRFARTTRDARRLQGWLIAVGPAVLAAFVAAGAWWMWRSNVVVDEAMANRERHWFPPADALSGFTTAVGAAIAAAVLGTIALACFLAAGGGAFVSLAGVWGRRVLNRGPAAGVGGSDD